jgi:TetR/AcrR family transcriptional regulator, regulator of cefoperazone and chloramphenicol sensitivity
MVNKNSAQAEALVGAKSKASRERLLFAALRCFAEHGYAKTSTRMIAQAAGANLAAIRYYFEDKAGIYRAAFIEPMGSPRDDIPLFNQPGMTLEQALAGLYSGFIEPLKQGVAVQLCNKLHMREMVEPTGLWQDQINNGIAPYVQSLVKLLCRHMNLKTADDALYRLAFSIAAPGVFLFMANDVYNGVRPSLLKDHTALDQQLTHMTQCAMQMVEAEKLRRQHAMKTRKK